MEEFRREFEREFSLGQLVEQVTREVPPVDEQELRIRYEADPSRFTTPEVVRAGHIVLYVNDQRTREAALEGIGEIQRKLREGEVFEGLAGRFSDCPENDGDLGYFPRGEMVEEFEDVVFTMAPGEVSDIIETPFGFHIAKLYEKRAGSLVPFERVKDALAEERLREAKAGLLEQHIDSLRAAATIVEEP